MSWIHRTPGGGTVIDGMEDPFVSKQAQPPAEAPKPATKTKSLDQAAKPSPPFRWSDEEFSSPEGRRLKQVSGGRWELAKEEDEYRLAAPPPQPERGFRMKATKFRNYDASPVRGSGQQAPPPPPPVDASQTMSDSDKVPILERELLKSWEVLRARDAEIEHLRNIISDLTARAASATGQAQQAGGNGNGN